MNIIHRLSVKLQESKYKKMAVSYNISGYKRIYFIHIRKCGGTSLNKMFLSLGQTDPESLYEQLAQAPSHRLIENGKIFVGWNIQLINKGHYYYAFSHAPLYKLNLPPKTFTVTCFRDPIKRVVSHYNMLMHYASNNISHPCMTIEKDWLGKSFSDFIERIPSAHLLNQLYMFSKRLDVNEAIENIKNNVSYYFFTENFNRGIDGLSSATGISLKPFHVRKASFKAKISSFDISALKEKLNKEYIMLESLIKASSSCETE